MGVVNNDENKLDFSKDVAIDQDALDVEWLNQASLFGKWSRLHADAEAKVGRLKHRLEVMEADLDNKVRTKPKSYGIAGERITEGAIKSAIILTKEHQELNSLYLKAQHNQAIIMSAVRSLAHKRDALENLVRLLGSEYFSGPLAPRDLNAEAIQKRTSGEAVKKMKKAVEGRK